MCQVCESFKPPDHPNPSTPPPLVPDDGPEHRSLFDQDWSVPRDALVAERDRLKSAVERLEIAVVDLVAELAYERLQSRWRAGFIVECLDRIDGRAGQDVEGLIAVVRDRLAREIAIEEDEEIEEA